MLAVNYTELRGNMKKCMDKVSDDFETLIVTRKKNKNIVMISEETYNNMMEIPVWESQNPYWVICLDFGAAESTKKTVWFTRLMKRTYILFHADIIIQTINKNFPIDNPQLIVYYSLQ